MKNVLAFFLGLMVVSALGWAQSSGYIERSRTFAPTITVQTARVTSDASVEGDFNVGRTIYLNGDAGNVGQCITSNGGGGTYWSTPAGGGGSAFDGGPLTVSSLTVTSDAGVAGNMGIGNHLDAGSISTVVLTAGGIDAGVLYTPGVASAATVLTSFVDAGSIVVTGNVRVAGNLDAGSIITVNALVGSLDAGTLILTGPLSLGGTHGTSGQVPQSNGPGAALSWVAAGGGGITGLTTNSIPYASSATTIASDIGLAKSSAVGATINASRGLFNARAAGTAQGAVISHATTSTVFGTPTLGVGLDEFQAGSYHTVGFGWVGTAGSNLYPVELGYVITDTSNQTVGDFVIGLRTNTTGTTVPTERFRIVGTSGNIVVDTNTFFVSPGTDRVGIGTITPSRLFHARAPTTAIPGAFSKTTAVTAYGNPTLGIGDSELTTNAYYTVGYGYTAAGAITYIGEIGIQETDVANSGGGDIVMAVRNGNGNTAATERYRIGGAAGVNQGAHQLTGGVNNTVTTFNATTTLDGTHRYVRMNVAAAATVNLPAVTGITGRVYSIKKVDPSVNVVTIDPSGAETIDGATTFPLAIQYESVTIVSNGSTGWDIFN